jgi:hypothetical protein
MSKKSKQPGKSPIERAQEYHVNELVGKFIEDVDAEKRGSIDDTLFTKAVVGLYQTLHRKLVAYGLRRLQTTPADFWNTVGEHNDVWNKVAERLNKHYAQGEELVKKDGFLTLTREMIERNKNETK